MTFARLILRRICNPPGGVFWACDFNRKLPPPPDLPVTAFAGATSAMCVCVCVAWVRSVAVWCHGSQGWGRATRATLYNSTSVNSTHDHSPITYVTIRYHPRPDSGGHLYEVKGSAALEYIHACNGMRWR